MTAPDPHPDGAHGRILSRRDGPVAWVTINNPDRHNAFSFDMFTAMTRTMSDLDANPATRVVVISGAGGKAFASGADISKFETERSSADQVAAYRDNADRMFDTVRGMSKPVIAMIHGWCIGGGLNLALNCDLRICDDRARFGIPAAKLGLGYSLKNTRAVVETVGPAAARDLLLTGRHVDAAEALRIGLVHDVVSGALEQVVGERAGLIAANAPLTLGLLKQAIALIAGAGTGCDAADIDRMVDACNSSDDYAEGRAAFKEKRPPVFRGT